MTKVNDGNEPVETEDVIDLFADGADEALVDEVVIEDTAGEELEEDEGKEAPAAASAIPSKFVGKSAEEIAASYEQLEREFGRRGNELGELRKITDDILKAQLSPTKQAESEGGITSETLLDDPQAAIDRAIANSPEVKALRADKAETASNVALERLKTDHPDAGAVIASPDFNAWINAIPSRAARYAKADNVQDFDVANELIATFKEVHPVSTPTPEQTAAADAARQAELDGVRGAKPGASNPGTKQKGKILLRADLMRLRQSDPDRYNRLGPQIEKAYAENRVR